MDAVEVVWVPALLGGCVAIGATLAIERWGGVIGGLIATLPTTIVPASFAILAGAATTASFQEAMAVVPVGMLINGIFLWTWRLLPQRLPELALGARLLLMTCVSLAIWAACSLVGLTALRALRDGGVPALAVGLVALLSLVAVGVGACLRPLPAPTGGTRVPGMVLLARGVLAGGAVGAAGALSATGVPLLAGLASVFPAIFLTTMVSLWWSQGEAVPAGAVGPMILGSSSVSAYAVLMAALVPWIGPVGGAVVAWICAVVAVTVPATTWLRRRAL